MPMPSRHLLRPLCLLGAAALVAGCSTGPSTTSLEKKLRLVNGLSAFQAKCVVTNLEHSLSPKQMRTVASADGRGGLVDRALINKVDEAVSHCVIVTTTTLPAQAPGTTAAGSASGSSTVVTQEP
jgi:hypothetical protein